MEDAQFREVTAGSESAPFCFIDWEHGNFACMGSVYYLEMPHPMGRPANHRFPVVSDGLGPFLNRLKQAGWQEFMSSAHPENYLKWLMRPPTLEAGYEFCVFSSSYSTAAHLNARPPKNEGLYRVGAVNQAIFIGDGWSTTFEQTEAYLEQENWQLVQTTEYPISERLPEHHLQVRLYRRALPAAAK